MKQTPLNVKILYDQHLIQKEIQKNVRFYYRKWLRYYLDFCDKYNFNQLKNGGP